MWDVILQGKMTRAYLDDQIGYDSDIKQICKQVEERAREMEKLDNG